MTTSPFISRTQNFCDDYNLRVPILMAPMAGACPPALAAAISNAGGMGACGALLMSETAIARWASDLRAMSNGAFQMNLWIPDDEPVRNLQQETAIRDFLGTWGPEVPEDAGDAPLQDFDTQCQAMLAAGPSVISSIMGLYPAAFVEAMKARSIRWFATVTTVEEALVAEAAGADVIVAQGAEAGGHRGAFDPDYAAQKAVGLFSLLPAIVDAVSVPVVATGGIADARGIAAALMLGASAVQIGTGFLRCPEAALSDVWADGIARSKPEDTMLTRAFSGRTGRSIVTDYTLAAQDESAPQPASYPVQRALTAKMRAEAAKENDLSKMQAWAGQSASLSRASPATRLTEELWRETCLLLT